MNGYPIPIGPLPSNPLAFSPAAGVYPRSQPQQLRANSRLGKRDRKSDFAPTLSEERKFKRPRLNVSFALGPNSQLEGSTEQPKAQRDQQWHLNDRFVRRFNRQELKAFIEHCRFPPDQNDPFPFGNDHGCPIHPLLRSLQSLAKFIPDLAPALRLATRFLLSKHTLPFFYSLITSPISSLQQESEYYQVPLFSLPPSPYAVTGLPPHEHHLTIQVLVALAPHIKFTFIPEERIENRWAYTERYNPPNYTGYKYDRLRRPYPHPADMHNPRQIQHQIPLTGLQHLLVNLNFHGTNTLINISTCFLKILHPTPSAPLTTSSKPTNPAQRLRAAYFLALTLLHELAHAVYLTRISPPPSNTNTEEHEPFYASHRRAELGHALETVLFAGGKLLSLANDPTFSIGLGWQRWPDTVSTYVPDPRTSHAIPLSQLVWSPSTLSLGGADLGALQPAQTPRWETVYAVRDAWIKRQFFREFWEGLEVLGMVRSGAFVVERTLGARCVNYDWLERDTGEGDGWGSTSSYGRGEDEDGVVRPGQPWRAFDIPEDEEEE